MLIDQTIEERVGVVSLAAARANMSLKVSQKRREGFVGCSLKQQSAVLRSSYLFQLSWKTADMLPDAYGCDVTNRFGNLLDDESDPFDLISESEREKEKRKKKKREEGEKKGKQRKPGQKESQRDRRVPIALDEPVPVPAFKQLAHTAPVTENGDDREEAQKRPPVGQHRASQEESPQESSISKVSHTADTDFRGRVWTRNRRGARSGGNLRNPDSRLRGKREYDRHNSSGVSGDNKRGGRGAWNWGCIEEVASEYTQGTSNSPVQSEDTQTSAEQESPNHSTKEEEGEMLVQMSVDMTLDEWKAIQEMSRPKAEFNIRKAESKIPSKAKVIHESKHVESITANTEDEGNFLRRSVNDITSLLDINFGTLGRPSRGGRGRARGGQSRCPPSVEPILETEEELAPDPDDLEDFPALSAGK